VHREAEDRLEHFLGGQLSAQAQDETRDPSAELARQLQAAPGNEEIDDRHLVGPLTGGHERPGAAVHHAHFQALAAQDER